MDGSGRLRYRGRVMSKQESPELRRALEAVLEGRPVRTPVTKAFGCAIGDWPGGRALHGALTSLPSLCLPIRMLGYWESVFQAVLIRRKLLEPKKR